MYVKVSDNTVTWEAEFRDLGGLIRNLMTLAMLQGYHHDTVWMEALHQAKGELGVKDIDLPGKIAAFKAAYKHLSATEDFKEGWYSALSELEEFINE